MPDITKIKIGNERERSYKDFPANREFKKRAEDENSGSSSDPILENAKETGGFGWEDSDGNEQVITWDGDIGDRFHVFGFGFNHVLMTTDVPPISEISNGQAVFHANGQNYPHALIDMSQEFPNVYRSSSTNVVVATEDTTTPSGWVFRKGIYFSVNNGGTMYTSSLVYGTPNTVHKINPKYIDDSVDVIIKYDGSDTPTLISGDFNAIAQKMVDNNPVSAVIIAYLLDDEYNEINTYHIPCCMSNVASEYDPTNIDIFTIYPLYNDGVFPTRTRIAWYKDGTITVYY